MSCVTPLSLKVHEPPVAADQFERVLAAGAIDGDAGRSRIDRGRSRGIDDAVVDLCVLPNSTITAALALTDNDLRRGRRKPNDRVVAVGIHGDGRAFAGHLPRRH